MFDLTLLRVTVMQSEVMHKEIRGWPTLCTWSSGQMYRAKSCQGIYFKYKSNTLLACSGRDGEVKSSSGLPTDR